MRAQVLILSYLGNFKEEVGEILCIDPQLFTQAPLNCYTCLECTDVYIELGLSDMIGLIILKTLAMLIALQLLQKLEAGM